MKIILLYVIAVSCKSQVSDQKPSGLESSKGVVSAREEASKREKDYEKRR
jgi:hypothetical protein